MLPDLGISSVRLEREAPQRDLRPPGVIPSVRLFWVLDIERFDLLQHTRDYRGWEHPVVKFRVEIHAPLEVVLDEETGRFSIRESVPRGMR